MQSTPWRYFIVTADGKTYRKEMGLIIAKNTRRSLQFTPISWNEIIVGYERDLEKWGVTRTFSLPLGFVMDGADILRTLLYKGNFEKKVYLLIQKQYLFLDPTHYYWYYDLFYKGQIDLTTAEDEEDKVTVQINEGGLIQDMKANEGTQYEIPCDEVTVKMDGIVLFESLDMYTVQNSEISKSLYGTSFIVPLLPFAQETNKPGASWVSSQVETTSDSVAYVNDPNQDNYFAIADQNNAGSIDLHIHGTLRYTCTANNLPFGLRFRFMKTSTTLATQEAYHFYLGVPVAGQTYDVPVDMHIPLNPGEKLYLRGAITGGVTGAIDLKFFFLQDSFFTVDYEYRKSPTWIKALFPLTLLQRLLAKISPGSVATSALLALFKNFVITSGDAIRGLDGAVVKIKYSDFYQSINSVLCTSEQISGKTIAVEAFTSAIVEANIIPLGEPRELKISMATELLVNTLRIGYPDQTYDDVNGKQEFNNTQIRTSPVTKVVKELDRVSTIRADGYGAEFLRINLAGKKTTDSASDNDPFFLDIDIDHPQSDVEHGVYYNLYRETYDEITGVLTPGSIFNVRLSPARMLVRQVPYVNSVFYGFEGGKLVWQTSDKNHELYTRKGTEIYDEDGDYTITAQGRAFIPFKFDFQPLSPANLVEQLQVNTNRCFSIQHWNGVTLNGFSLTMGVAANSEETQAYLLLSSPSNDLSLLI